KKIVGRAPFGIMLHHAEMDEKEREVFEELCCVLAAHPRVKFVSMLDLLAVNRRDFLAQSALVLREEYKIMKSIFLIITVFAALVFSPSVSGQTNPENNPPEKTKKTDWKVIVTDKTAKKDNSENVKTKNKAAETKLANGKAENNTAKTPVPTETEESLNAQPKTSDEEKTQPAEEKTKEEKT